MVPPSTSRSQPFSIFGSSTGLKSKKPSVRVERIPIVKKPVSAFHRPVDGDGSLSKREGSVKRVATSRSRASPATTDVDSDGSRVQQRKRKLTKRDVRETRVESDSSEDHDNLDIGAGDLFAGRVNKRLKREGAVDLGRKLRCSDDDSGHTQLSFIHAMNITEPGKGTAENESIPVVKLQYPSRSPREGYLMIYGKDRIDPLEEVLTVAKTVVDVYLTDEQRPVFADANAGLIRKMERARNMLTRDRASTELRDKFFDAVAAYNDAIADLVERDCLGRNLDSMHHLPHDMVQLMLRQVYDRAVSPKVDLLKQYENGTDNVYGELLYPFVSEILRRTKLKSHHTFVDLGSGVGNVVLQSALEIGCESWGCEMMENACALASAQEREFEARCRLWGIKTGTVHLEQGDFLENQRIQAAMRKADVILVNNQAFTSALNRRLIDLFLDVKDGCQIVSLKSFVPPDHKITSRNANDPVNVLKVIPGEYGSGSVSWTNVGGNYFIATKDGRRLEEYAALAG